MVMKDIDKEVIFRKAPYRMIMTMGRSKLLLNKSALHKKCDITYSHVVKKLDQLEDMGMVIIHNKEGRTVWVELSKLGKEWYDFLKRH